MNPDLAHLVELSQKHSFVFEFTGGSPRYVSLLFFDESGVLGYYFVTQDDPKVFSSFLDSLFSSNVMKVCFGMRQVVENGLEFKSYCDIIDVSLFYEGERLQNIANSVLSADDVDEFNDVSRKMAAHVKACEIAQVDMEVNDVCKAIPSKIVVTYHRAMAVMVLALYKKLDREDIDLYESDFRFFTALYRIERNGIKVNLDVAPVSLNTSERRFVEEVKKHTGNDRLLRIRFAPRATKTDRLTIERGSFNFMNVPATRVRSVIESRFEGGKIVSFDFNAIDYRCLIASIDDMWLKSQYDSGVDFHSRTVELLMGPGSSTPERRKIVKLFTYVVMYGGAEGSLHNLGLSREKVGILFRKMKKLLTPVEEFANELHRRSVTDGYISVPEGKRIPIQGHERPSYILSIYAQACSSRVFARAVRQADVLLSERYKSMGIFTVHDEYVMDWHPEDVYVIGLLRQVMEGAGLVVMGSTFMVDVNEGQNYWEVT